MAKKHKGNQLRHMHAWYRTDRDSACIELTDGRDFRVKYSKLDKTLYLPESWDWTPINSLYVVAFCNDVLGMKDISAQELRDAMNTQLPLCGVAVRPLRVWDEFD